MIPCRYTTIFSTEALGFVRRVRPSVAQDAAENLQSLAARAFLWTAIAWEKGEEEVEQFLPHAKLWMNSICHSYGHRLVQPWLWPDWAFFGLTKSGRSIRRLTKPIEAFCRGAIAARRVQLQQQKYSLYAYSSAILKNEKIKRTLLISFYKYLIECLQSKIGFCSVNEFKFYFIKIKSFRTTRNFFLSGILESARFLFL